MKTLAIALCLIATPALAQEHPNRAIPADVVKLYDGDTVTVDAHVWPGVTIRTAVRVNGIDTPELRRPHAKCEAEMALAERARELIAARLGERVTLTNIFLGKYAGRVVADVTTEEGESVARILLEAGLAREYHGGRREGWC
jgi:micrococcal nuclease